MRRASAFGIYVKGDSFVHRLDARAKLAAVAALSVSSFLCVSLPVVCALALACVAVAAAGGVTARSLVRFCLPLLALLAVAFATNALVGPAAADVALVGSVGLSAAGAARGALFALRVFALVVLTLAVCATTSIAQLSRAFAAFLRPLRRWIPVDDVAMTLTLAIRFIPLAEEELARIRDAQAARGLLGADAGLWERLRGWGSAFVPLVVGLFVRAEHVADAMRDRCYGACERAWVKTPLDAASRLALAGSLVVSILIAWV